MLYSVLELFEYHRSCSRFGPVAYLYYRDVGDAIDCPLANVVSPCYSWSSVLSLVINLPIEDMKLWKDAEKT